MRVTLLVTVLLGLVASGAQAQDKAKAQPPAPQPPADKPAQLQTDEEKILYAFGHSFGKNLGIFNLSPAEFEVLKKGIFDGYSGAPPAVEVEPYASRIQGLARARRTQANEAYLARAAQEPGAVKLPSGIIYKVLKPGSGPSPKPKDTVSVHYRGTLITGEEFDSSIRRNQPAEFPLNGVIKCWTEGLQQMKVGTKAKLVCPPHLAYGERPQPGSKIPPNAVLEFEVELLAIPGDTSKR